MGLDNNNIVNNIIFFKLRKERLDTLKAQEDLYLNSLALSYKNSDFSFLEDDFIKEHAAQFYMDLGDFSFNANSLLFDLNRKTWDESISDNEDLLFNKLENMIDNMAIPFFDDVIKPAFFLSDYFGNIIKEKAAYKEYYENWKAQKNIKETFGEDSLSYKGLINEWSKDASKTEVEQEVLEFVAKEIKRIGKERVALKNKIVENKKMPVSSGLDYEIVSTTFNPKNFCTSNSEWEKFTIGKAEINALLASNSKEFDLNTDFKNTIETIDFEFCFLRIFRDWFNEDFLESPLWTSKKTISAYPTKLIFIRKVSYKQKTTTTPLSVNHTQLFKGNFNVAAIDKLKTSGISKAYLNRNAVRKMKLKMLKKSAPTVLNKKVITTAKTARFGGTFKAAIFMNKLKIARPAVKFPCRISLFSDTKIPVSNAQMKLFQNGKMLSYKIRIINNTYQFDILNAQPHSVRISHPEFLDKILEIKISRKHLRSKKYSASVHLTYKMEKVSTLEEEELLLIGCIGKSISKENVPIEGVKYH